MNKARRAFGALMYVFLALPALLGGLASVSVSRLADPALYKALVRDERFAAILRSPELPEAADGDVTIGGISFDGPSFVAGLQAAVPVEVVVDTAEGMIDDVAGLARGASLESLDISPVKRALADNADAFVAAYAGRLASDAPASPAAPALDGRAFRSAVDGIPDAIALDREAGTGVELASVDLPAKPTGWALTVSGMALALASAFVSRGRLRDSLGKFGHRLIGPGAVFLAVGLVPFLVNPAGFVGEAARRAFSGVDIAGLPVFVSYAKYAAQSLTAGFLVAGGVVAGLGVALTIAGNAIPPSDDEGREDADA